VQLLHQALPERALADVQCAVEFFGKRLQAPLMITSMTGGAERAGELNHALAAAAEQAGVAFAVGSQRVLLKNPEYRADFSVRAELGADGVLLGNIGAAQLIQLPPGAIAQLAEDIDADGICVHLNAAHELAQDEGDRSFGGVVDALAALVEAMPGRVLVKETGAGLSPEALALLAGSGVQYIDVGGAGWHLLDTCRGLPRAYAGGQRRGADIWRLGRADGVFDRGRAPHLPAAVPHHRRGRNPDRAGRGARDRLRRAPGGAGAAGAASLP